MFGFLQPLLMELRRGRLARLLSSHRFDGWLYPDGFEREVVDCLCNTKWDGPVWDVGGATGKIAYYAARHHKVYCFEPNLNVLYYLGFNLAGMENVVIVPAALTLDGSDMKGTCDPDYHAEPTGPKVMTLSIEEAIRKFGRPGVIKLDIEGGEYDLLNSSALHGFPLVVEWHREIPDQLEHWEVKHLDKEHSLLTPKTR